MRPASANRALNRSGSSELNLPRTASGKSFGSRGSFGVSDRYHLDSIGSPKSDHSNGSQMLETKFSRKRAETDLQLLANRIALLKLEEQKALQKVQETKQRAEEILETKRKHQEFLEQKRRQQQEREEQIRRTQMKAQQEREERRMKINSSQKLIYDSRKALAEAKKEESKKLVQYAEHGKVYSEYEKRKRAEEERKRREHLRLQREKEKLEKEEEIRYLHAKKLEEENVKRQKAEEMIRLLENEEKDLIHRLRRTQQLQQDAYSVLQESLNA